MTDCCSTAKKTKLNCPVNGLEYIEVPVRTMLYHLNKPWLHELAPQKYYFCTDMHCDVVYFSEDNTVIRKPDLRHLVGIKEESNEAMLCYCFGVTRQAALEDKNLKEYVIDQTRLSACACEVLNPAGRCCLKDFPKPGALI